jgi:hypothetical protein
MSVDLVCDLWLGRVLKTRKLARYLHAVMTLICSVPQACYFGSSALMEGTSLEEEEDKKRKGE